MTSFCEKKKWTNVYGSRLWHIFDEPSISKHIFLIYLVYLMIYLVYQIFVIAKRSITFKGTLMQIWKSASIFVFIWKQCVEDLTFKHLLPFEICVREICEKLFANIQKQYNMLKISLLKKEIYKVHGQITRELLGLRMRNFQSIILI